MVYRLWDLRFLKFRAFFSQRAWELLCSRKAKQTIALLVTMIIFAADLLIQTCLLRNGRLVSFFSKISSRFAVVKPLRP